jgi:hypothetical protein
MIHAFGNRLSMLHISEIDSDGQHEPLTQLSVMAYSTLSSLLPQNLPVIIESPVEPRDILIEMAKVCAALGADSSISLSGTL